MELRANDHVYKVIPDLFGNAESDNPAVFHLIGISQDHFSEAVRAESVISQNHTREEAARKISENAQKLVADRVVKIENLIIGGEEVTDYAGLVKYGPRELVNWIVAAVHSTDILNEYEIKN
jgi:hypothetical protein